MSLGVGGEGLEEKGWPLVESQWNQVGVGGVATEGEARPGVVSGGEALLPTLPARASPSQAVASQPAT